MTDIFLSYASEDRIKAGALAQVFEELGWSVWWDRNLTPGSDWEPAILDGVADARCVVVIWSRDSVRKEWVVREAKVGLDRGVLVPVLLQPSHLPNPTPQVQAVELSVWNGGKTADLRPLLQAIAAKLGRGSIPTLEDAGPRDRLARYSDQLSRTEVAQAVLAYCVLSVVHRRLRVQGHRFSEEEFEGLQSAYDRLKRVLSTSDHEVGELDLHNLLSGFLNELEPEI
jgi:hypothetical protein